MFVLNKNTGTTHVQMSTSAINASAQPTINTISSAPPKFSRSTTPAKPLWMPYTVVPSAGPDVEIIEPASANDDTFPKAETILSASVEQSSGS